MKDIAFAEWSSDLEQRSTPFEHLLQTPARQVKDHISFVCRDDVQWRSRQSNFGNKSIVQEAFLRTSCVNDFLRGEAELFQTKFTTANQQKTRNSAADIKKVQKNSYLVKLDLHCAYSGYRTQKLADSHQKPESLTQAQHAPGSRISRCAREDSCKIGCQYKVSIVQYALWPWATCITLQSMDHANADGQQVHGPEAESSQSRKNVAPHLSDFVKQLVLSLATLWVDSNLDPSRPSRQKAG
ncbi:hypothetical protein ABBQ38_014943 [Trebouxia sp. C0009 RCD-2024]